MANLNADCPAPTVVNGRSPATCIEGNSIPHGGNCTPLCAVYYATGDSVMTCTHGILTPSTFTCSLIRYVPPRWAGTTPSPAAVTTTDASQWTVTDHWYAQVIGALIATLVACSFLVVVRAAVRTKRKRRNKLPQELDEYGEDAYTYGAEWNEPEPVTRAPQKTRTQPKAAVQQVPSPPSATPSVPSAGSGSAKQTAIGASSSAKKAAAPPPTPVKPPPPVKQVKAPPPKPAPTASPAVSPRSEDCERDRHGHYEMFG